jgi:hypothetical protein
MGDNRRKSHYENREAAHNKSMKAKNKIPKKTALKKI